MHSPSFLCAALAGGLFGALPARADIIATGSSLLGVEGKAVSGPVAKFTDPDHSETPSDFTAVIDWGDGAASAGTVLADPSGGFDVQGSHTYGSMGLYNSTVTITDTDGSSALITDRNFITDLPLALVASPLTGLAGVRVTGLLGGIVGSNRVSLADLTVTIDWGDGAPDGVGDIVTGPGGGFDVFGTHTYLVPGDYTLTLIAQDAGGESAIGTSRVDIAAAVAPPLPEPGSLSLLALAAPALLLRRRFHF